MLFLMLIVLILQAPTSAAEKDSPFSSLTQFLLFNIFQAQNLWIGIMSLTFYFSPGCANILP